MIVLSINFLIMVAITVLIFWILPSKFRWMSLLISSCIFIWYANEKRIESCILMFIMIIVAYIAAMIFKKLRGYERIKKIVIIITILFEIGMLIILKDSAFFQRLFHIEDNNLNCIDFLVPVGMSYFTLSLVGYILDTYWGIQEAQKNPFKFMLFGAYFPLLTSGPIVRYKDFSEELYKQDSFSYYKFCFALQRILWGVFKKLVISERLAIIVNTIYGDVVTYRGLYIWFAMACFVLQLYTDFTGCLDILFGVSELFGIELPENFNMPFTSRNISEFWRRWHITLGLWLKDYVLYPILKSRPLLILGEKTRSIFGKRIGKKIPVWCGLLITWFLIGFWHGGSWNYIIGVGLWMWFIIVLSDISDPILKKTTKILHIKTNCFSWYIFQSLRTYFIFMFGLGMFPVSSFSSGIQVYRAAFYEFNPNIFLNGSLLQLGLNFMDYFILLLSLIILIGMGIIKLVSKVSVREWISMQNLYFKWAIWIFMIVFVLVFGKYSIGYDVSNFIYGGF